MNSQDRTTVYKAQWGLRGFALEIIIFCLLQGIGVAFYLVNNGAYASIGNYFRLSAWFAIGALRFVRNFPLISAEIRRMRKAIKSTKTRGSWTAEQPSIPPTRREWTIALIGVTVMCVIGLVLAYGQPPLRIHCGRGQAGRVDCRVQQRMLWIIPVGEQIIPDVQTAQASEDVRTKTGQEFSEAGDSHTERDIQLAFTNSDHRETVITLDGAFGGSFNDTAAQIRELSAADGPQSISAWHAPDLPTVVSLGFIFVPCLVYYSALSQFWKTHRASIKRMRRPHSVKRRLPHLRNLHFFSARLWQ